MRVIENREYDSDPSGHLLYWDCVQGRYPILEPARPITDPNLVIGRIGQQNVLPNHLLFNRSDFLPTEIVDEEGSPISLIPPGLSAFLFFQSQQEGNDIKTIKDMHRKSRIHIAQVRDITKAGWTVYHAPLINHLRGFQFAVHVIITPNSLQNSSSGQEATAEEREALARVFVRWS